MENVSNKVKVWMLANKNLLIILFAALFILTAEIWQYRVARKNAINNVERITSQELASINQTICDKLSVWEMAVDCISWGIEDNTKEPDSIQRFLIQLMKSSPDIQSCSACFEPYFYPQKGRLYEPVALKDKDGNIIISQIAGPNHDYTEIAFYKNTMACDSDYWSEPYTNGADHTMIVSYSLTLHDKKQKAFGALTADISLDWLSNIANQAYTPLPSSFVTIISSEGNVVACPKERRDDLFRWFGNNKDKDLLEIGHLQAKLSAKKTGRYNFTTPDGKKNLIFFEEIKAKPNWIIAKIGSEEEIYHKLYKDMQRRLLITFASILLLALIIWYSIRNITRLKIATEEKARIDSDLRAAANIQQGMLPKHFPPFPDRDDIDVFGLLLPAKEIGGDLYDFYVRDEKLFFCIGDVSGKGMPASLMMAVTRSMFRIISAHENSPQHIVEQMNNLVNEMNEFSLFVTTFVGVLDLPTGLLRYCNAGHDAPLLINKNVKKMDVLANLPIGVMPGILYMGQEITIESETMMFLYTDGLVEARNSRREMFREHRMIETAKRSLETGNIQPDIFTKEMTNAVKEFTGDEPQFDDLTTLAIRYTKPVHAKLLNRKITLKNDIQQLPRLKTFIDNLVQELQLKKTMAMKLNLAMEEAVVNVMEYAYLPNTEGDIDVIAEADNIQLTFIIVDHGVAFDPTASNKVDTTLTLEERPIGGLGIHLVRQYMDSINYERINHENILTLIKRL